MSQLKQKIILILFGLFLCALILETGLRLNGFIFLFLQEHKNRIVMQRKDAYRIMCLGESTTALGGDDSYPRQLEKILNQKDTGIKFSVINKGLSGTNTSAILAQLDENLNKYKPDMVITMMGINDASGGYYVMPGDTFVSKTILFLKSFRIFKLAKLLWEHIVYKFDFEHNIRALECSIKSNPANDRLSFELAELYKRQGNLESAEEIYKKIIELNPKSNEAYAKLGMLYEAENKLFLAEEALKKAIELNPNSDAAICVLAIVYKRCKKFAEAEEFFKKAVKLKPGFSVAYFQLRMCYIEQGKLVDAEQAFKDAIKVDPNNDRAYGRLALLYEGTERHVLAQEYFDKVNQLWLKLYVGPIYSNYRQLKESLDKKGIKLVCAQYPMRSIEPLKRILGPYEGVIFIDNEKVFKEAVQQTNHNEYFKDMFGGDFGHLASKGNRLLAENITNNILGEFSYKREK